MISNVWYYSPAWTTVDKTVFLALRSNLDVCPHSRELFSHTFKRCARSLRCVVFYSIVIECQSYAFQDYVLSGLFNKICFAAGKGIISCGFCSFQTLTLYQGVHIPSVSSLTQGDLSCMSCSLIFWSNWSYHSSALKHGIIFTLSYNWSADPPCSNHRW